MAKATIPINDRLEEKTALSLYTNYLIYRYNFSRVIAESLYNDARYFQLLFDKTKREDGQIFYYAVHRNEPAGKALKDCHYVRLKLTLHHPDDVKKRAEQGLVGLRRYKLKRITDEAVVQDAPLTQEDCAHILDSDRRTIIRDLAALKKRGIEITTRSHFTDQGRGMTHKERIIKLFLQGFSLTEVADHSKHLITNVQKYIHDFLRISLLYKDGKESLMISRITKVSKRLAEEYIALNEKLQADSGFREPLERQLNFYASQLNLAIFKKNKEVI